MSGKPGVLDRTLTAAILGLLAYGAVRALVPPAVRAGVRSLGTGGWYTTVGTAVAWLSLAAGTTIGPLWVSPAEFIWKHVPSVLRRRRAYVLPAGPGAAVCTGLLLWAGDPGDPVVVRTALLTAVVAGVGWLASSALQHLNSPVFSRALILALTVTCSFGSQAARPLKAMLTTPALARIHLPGRRGPANPVLRAYVASMILFMLLGVGVLGTDPGSWCAIVLSSAFFVLRRTSTDRAGFSAGPLMASPMGPVPLGLFRRRSAGADVFVVTVWLILGGTPGAVVAAVLGAALIAYVPIFTARGR